MLVNIISLFKIIYQDEVDSLTVPGIEGRLTVLPHHVPLVTILKKGRLFLRKNGKEISFDIEKAILEVKPREVDVLVIEPE